MAEANESGAASRLRRRPEVLAPAGDDEAMVAALSAGADAVYFGLSEGFNARARAGNFTAATLPATVARIHRAGARAYLTLNTLVFETELEAVERLIRAAAAAGVDALIVQDPAVALIARAAAPSLEVHASTQMTISSPEAAEFARTLGVTRVVVPRELSVEEIRRFAAATDLELEVFIHGALCVAWSGQCLTSATWSGRSANRGECAQSCRLPYDLVLDGRVRDLGDVKYLLSPKDLAGLRAVADLAAIGVHGLKIEGRQKSAPYVLTATRTYRHYVDAVVAGGPTPEADERARRDLRASALAYTRGFSDGFLGGSDHQTLVEGRFPKHRGLLLGRVVRVLGDSVLVARDPEGRPWTGAIAADEPREAPRGTPVAARSGMGGPSGSSGGPRPADVEVRAGMGVVFDAGSPEDEHEPGGPIFRVGAAPEGWRLAFGSPGPDLSRVVPGHRVWITSDPAIPRETERALRSEEPEGRLPLSLTLRGRAGAPLEVEAASLHARTRLSSAVPLAVATGRGLDEPLVREKLGQLGGTPFRLQGVDLADLAPGLHLPVSEVKALRRRLVADLLPAIERGPGREVATGSVLPLVRRAAGAALQAGGRGRIDLDTAPRLVPLCREQGQLEAVIEAGLPEVELDWMEMVGLQWAVTRARAEGLRVTVATVRVQKPGEEGYDRRLAALEPDAVLVRHWGALVWFQGRQGGAGRPPLLHGDFSLNVTNAITAAELFRRGLDTLTASHDLDARQLAALLDASDAARFTVVLHHRMPTFHTEHCVYAHLLSEGRDFHTCGRPCERHRVSLRDARGREHPVIVDVACRNTVFNDQPQSAAELAGDLIRRGVRRFRVEFVRETASEARAILGAYQGLLAGRIAPREAMACAQAAMQLGVSGAPMAVLE